MQVILVHTITKFYYPNPSCFREMQGDAKLHNPPGMGCSETSGIGLRRSLIRLECILLVDNYHDSSDIQINIPTSDIKALTHTMRSVVNDSRENWWQKV